MKSIIRYQVFASLIALTVFGCKHPSAPVSEPPTITTIDGAVAQLDTVRSTFDTAFWLPDTGLKIHLDATNTSRDTLTNSASWYWFYHLNLQDATLTVAQPGYAEIKVWHAQSGSSYPERPANDYNIYAPFNVLLVPSSWLSVTIDNFAPNIDTSIVSKHVGVQTDAKGDTTNFGTLVSDTEISSEGIYTIAHIHSMRPDKPSLGYISLYISRNPGIDPTNPSTYDMIFGGSPVRDSTIKVVLPQNIGQYYGANYSSGTMVYCKAYAYPFPGQPRYSDQSGNKSVFYGIRSYPSNTMTFQSP